MSIVDWIKGKLKGKDEEPRKMEESAACSRCGFEYPISVMLFGEDGKFCRDCMPLHKKEKEDSEFKKEQAELLSKIKYFCHNCKFHFSRKKDFQIGACPNCGSDNFTPESKLM